MFHSNTGTVPTPTVAFCKPCTSFSLLLLKVLPPNSLRDCSCYVVIATNIASNQFPSSPFWFCTLTPWTDVKKKNVSKTSKQVLQKNKNSVSSRPLFLECHSTSNKPLETYLLAPLAISVKIFRPTLFFSINTPKHLLPKLPVRPLPSTQKYFTSAVILMLQILFLHRANARGSSHHLTS